MKPTRLNSMMKLTFLPTNRSLMGQQVVFGDGLVTLAWVSSKSTLCPISNFKRKTTNLMGGYLVMDGSGKKVTFRIDNGDPVVVAKEPKRITIKTKPIKRLPKATVQAFTKTDWLFWAGVLTLLCSLIQGNFGWTAGGVTLVVLVVSFYFLVAPKLRAIKQTHYDEYISLQQQKQPQQSSSVASTRSARTISSAASQPSEAKRVPTLQSAEGKDGGMVLPIGHFERFLRGEKGNQETAEERWKKTNIYRKETGLNHTLLQPHPHFEMLKRHTCQYYHKSTVTGQYVYYEKPGKLNLKALRAEGIEFEHILHHFLYVTEYLWRKLDTEPLAQVMSIIDLSGIGLSDFTGPIMGNVKQISGITGEHYPERSYQIFILNPPFLFTSVWNLIKQFMDKNTVAKTHVIKDKKSATRKLLEFIDAKDLPKEYGGECTCNPDPNSDESLCHVNSVEELAIKAHVEATNAKQNSTTTAT